MCLFGKNPIGAMVFFLFSCLSVFGSPSGYLTGVQQQAAIGGMSAVAQGKLKAEAPAILTYWSVGNPFSLS